MQAEDAHLELAEDEDDSDEESDNELGGSEAENSNDETVYEEQVGGFRIGERAEPRGGDVEEDVGGNVTEDSEGEPGENNPGNLLNAMEPLSIGDTVEAHGKTWKRVEGLTVDARTEPVEASKFKRLHYNESTREVDIFWQLMPLTKEDLLQIVREGAQTARDRRQWQVEHIEAALCVIFGGAQYKAGTNLWATTKKGMLRAPDFGMHLSQDKFKKILRYWSKGPDGTTEKLRDYPWEEVDIWIRGFNKNRQAEIEVGTDITPDEMMFEWTGQEGPGGIPF